MKKYYYNFNLFLNIQTFQVLFNFEYFKYEDDKILYSNVKIKNYKNKKKVLMHTDFYDYIKRKNRVRVINKYTWDKPHYNLPWNIIDTEEDDIPQNKKTKTHKDLNSHLAWQRNIFFCYIIYEFFLKIYNKFLCSFFNSDFFNKVLIFKDNDKNKEIKKYPSFLSSAYYNYTYHLLKLNKN